ncbi:MAG: outer membrane beta-barrel protein [Acidobacteriaceae bacterium]
MAFSAHAQFTSSVQGTVTDPSGAVVDGATVTLTNIGTNVSHVFVTDKAGLYVFNSVAPGRYRVSVEAPGFQKTVVTQRVTTEQVAGINIELKVGNASSTVSVSADNEGHGLNPQETRLQYTLGAREIADYPLQNQATEGLFSTAPGATGIVEGAQNIAANTQSPTVSTNGRSNESNLYLLDFVPLNTELGGFSQTNSTGHGPGSMPIIPQPDMLQEITLDSTTFSVENGFSSGIQVSMTTKSGSNKFHGDLDYTYTGGPFAANAAFTTKKTPFRRQYVSLALGGPIWKDHTYFFGSYFNQQVANSGGALQSFYAPEFVAWAQQNYPNSQGISQGLVPNPADRATNVRTIQYGNSLDPHGCGTVGGSYPALPCDLPIEDLGSYAAPATTNGAQYNFRLDHTMRQGKDRVYASFLRFDGKSVHTSIQSTLDGVLPATGYYLAANYTHQFGSTLVNQLSFGQSRSDFAYLPTAHSENQLKLPYLSGCFCSALVQPIFDFELYAHQTFLRDNVDWVKGKHNLNFGFEWANNNEVNDNSIVFARPFLQNNFTIYNYLRDITDLELIFTLSGSTGKFIPQLFGAQSKRVGAYVQDNWQLTPNLVLNYGFRWDDYGNPSTYGKNAEPFSNVVLTPGSTLQQQVAGASSVAVKNVYSSARWANFMPRASFAYTVPGSNHKLLVHGGMGLYMDDLNLNEIANNLPTQPPVRLSLTLMQNTTPKPVTSYGTSTVMGPPGGNPYGFQFPNIVINGYTQKGAPLDPNGNVIVGDLNGSYQNLQPQKSLIYNFGFEQGLAKNIVVGLLYTGSHGSGQLIQTDVNTYAGLTSNPANQRYNTEFGKIKFFRNDGVSNYNALIAIARQTFGRLSYQASYTWGHALADPTNNTTDQYNISSQYSNASYDIRNRFSFLGVYEFPAHFSSQLFDQVLGGWSISNTVVAQSGTPFTVADTSGYHDYNKDNVFFDIPVYNGTKRHFSHADMQKSAYARQSVFGNNATAFSAPPGVTEGGLQNTFYGSGYFDFDTGISKKILVPWFEGEKASLKLRAVAINTLNHTNWGNPSGESSNHSSLGVVTSAFQHRIIQIGGRLEF